MAESKVIYTEVDLPEFDAIDKKIADNGDILYTLSPKERPTECPECHSSTIHVHKKVTRQAQDLDMFGHRVGLLVDGRSYRCDSCGALIRMEFPSLSGRMTKRLADTITQESFIYTFADVARRHHTTTTTVATLFNEKADEMMLQHKFVAPDVLGMDEVHLEDDYRGVYVHVNQTEGRVLEFTEKRNYKSVVKTLKSMEHPENLKLVTMDMWKPYKQAVNDLFPDVPIVIDHFHVIKNLIKAMDDVRVTMSKSIKDTSQRKKLKHSRFLMLTNNEDLTAKQGKALAELFAAYPEFETVYTLKEAFRDIYNTATGSAEGRQMFDEWIESCHSNGITAYDSFINTVNTWSKEIFEYFDHPDVARTNAQTESLNRTIRDTARQGRGYSFEVLRKKVILKKYMFEPTEKFSFKIFEDM